MTSNLACIQQLAISKLMMVRPYMTPLTVMSLTQMSLGLCMSAHSCLSPQQMYIMTHEGHMSHELTCHEIAHQAIDVRS